MPSPLPMFDLEKLIKFDRELYERLSEFRFSSRFPSLSSAVRVLLCFALDTIDSGEPAPLPDEDLERVRAFRKNNPISREREKTVGKLAAREAEVRKLLER